MTQALKDVDRKASGVSTVLNYALGERALALVSFRCEGGWNEITLAYGGKLFAFAYRFHMLPRFGSVCNYLAER